MADIGKIAEKRYATLERLLQTLGMEHARIPSTKVDPIQTEAFYAEILAALAERVVALEDKPVKG
jgi:hypothetical protein